MAEAKQTTSTKDFVEIADIRDNVVILKDGTLRGVVEVSSMNFELKSADEQTAIISAFQNFLNSVDFPLQIVINSRKLDIGPYLKSLDTLQQTIQNELLKIQAVEYTRFIKGLTELANIMAKKFYISVPFHVIEAPTKEGGGIFGAIKSTVKPSKFIKTITDQELEQYKIQLEQRIEVIMTGLSGMGLDTRTLGREDLMTLFYGYYNPGQRL